MLGMTDQIMRLYGHDEEAFKKRIAEFMWRNISQRQWFTGYQSFDCRCLSTLNITDKVVR
jgi:hypothetical protein